MKIVWGRSIGFNLELRSMKITQIITDGCDCYPWHEVFVWWPRTTVGGRRVWWTKVYKRKVWAVWGTGFHMEPLVQYATLFEMLAQKDDILGHGY